MRLSLNTLALLLCAASFATTTMAQSPERGPDRQRPEGPHADRAPSAEAIFDRLDANHDGNLSREEFQKGHERMRAAMAAHHRPEGPPRMNADRPRGEDQRGPRADQHERGRREGMDHRGPSTQARGPKGSHRPQRSGGPRHWAGPQRNQHGPQRGSFAAHQWHRGPRHGFHSHRGYAGFGGPRWAPQRSHFGPRGPQFGPGRGFGMQSHRHAPPQFAWHNHEFRGHHGPGSDMRPPHDRPQFRGHDEGGPRTHQRDGRHEQSRGPREQGEQRGMHMPPRPSFGGDQRPGMAMRPSHEGRPDGEFRRPEPRDEQRNADHPRHFGERDGRPPMKRDEARSERPEGRRPGSGEESHEGKPRRESHEAHRPMGPPKGDGVRPEQREERKAKPEAKTEKSSRPDEKAERQERKPSGQKEDSSSNAEKKTDGSRDENQTGEPVETTSDASLTEAATAEETATVPPTVALAEQIPVSNEAP